MNKSQKTFAQHIPDYLDWIDVEKGLSSQTQENYARFIQRFLQWLDKNDLTNLKPHELTAEHVWEYRIYLARHTRSQQSGKNLHKSTQSYYLIVLRSLLNYFTERNILSLPSEKIRLPRDKADTEVRFLSLKQLERLFGVPDIATPKGIRDRALLETLFSTGMRVSELTALNRDQVVHSLDKNELELGIVGKGGRTRTVYFSPRTLTWLKTYLSTRTDQEDALFINQRGRKDASRRLTPRSIEIMVKRYAILAGLPENTTPHVLRHSFATDLLGQGVDIRILQEFLGHKSITATQIYAHVTSKKLREIHRQHHSGDQLDI